MKLIDPYKNLKHIKAFKEHKTSDDTEEDSSEDSKLKVFPFRCKNCREYYDLVYDEFHGEIICRKCGHVIQSNIQL